MGDDHQPQASRSTGGPEGLPLRTQKSPRSRAVIPHSGFPGSSGRQATRRYRPRSCRLRRPEVPGRAVVVNRASCRAAGWPNPPAARRRPGAPARRPFLHRVLDPGFDDRRFRRAARRPRRSPFATTVRGDPHRFPSRQEELCSPSANMAVGAIPGEGSKEGSRGQGQCGWESFHLTPESVTPNPEAAGNSRSSYASSLLMASRMRWRRRKRG
jgi:hypothetical protein